MNILNQLLCSIIKWVKSSSLSSSTCSSSPKISIQNLLVYPLESHCLISTKKEHNNLHDRFTVAVMKGKLIVGHIPKEISKICWFFLHKGGTIRCTVKDKRRSSIKQGGLEVPRELTFSIPKGTKDNETIMSKLSKLLT